MNKLLLIIFVGIASIGYAQKIPADLLVFNAQIYTIDEQFLIQEAMAIKDGKILATGTTVELQNKFSSKKNLDAKRKFIYPGFIDAHAHFFEYGLGLQSVDLTGTKSWEEIILKLKAYSLKNKSGWIIGKGWDQNDWKIKTFPNSQQLDLLFPDRPVFLSRVDGHAAIANSIAMKGIQPGTKLIGGEIETKEGKLTGILVDNAVELVSKNIPAPNFLQKKSALLQAQANCFAVGLTTIDDCGLQYADIKLIEELQQSNELKMRLYVMMSDNESNLDSIFSRGKIKTSRLNVRSVKVYSDGALGSRGACLLAPYSDKPQSSGFLLSQQSHFNEVAAKIFKNGFQMCTHAIGDSGNRIMLSIYSKYLKGKNDLRWRIEHAQVVNQNDFDLFGSNSIIPSVQPTHATSDMYWAIDRIGSDKLKGAYAYQQLLDQNKWIPLGTDFPVEDISPFKTFYAACIRKDAKGWPESGFQIKNAIKRKDALRGMTIWAARANFEENEKGSLEKGKFADFIILNTDLLKVNAAGILNTVVLKTYLNGELVYEKK